MPPSPIELRVADMERKIAVHEAVCAERYKAVAVRMNTILAIQGLIVIMLAGGSPVASAIQATFAAAGAP